MQVEIKSISSLQGYIGSARTEKDLSSQTAISAYDRNFTQPNTKNFYIVLSPQAGSSRGYSAEIVVRYYTYDPNCAINTYWNDTDCIPDYELYCSSLTDQYKVALKRDDITVAYNGTACVIYTPNVVEQYVINGTSGVEIADRLNATFTTVSTRPKKDSVISNDKTLLLRLGNKILHYGELIGIGTIVLGLIVYMVVSWRAERKAKFEAAQQELANELEADRIAAEYAKEMVMNGLIDVDDDEILIPERIR